MEQARRSYGKHQVNEIKAHLPLTCKDVAVHTASATKYLELVRCDSSDESEDSDKRLWPFQHIGNRHTSLTKPTSSTGGQT